MPKRIIVLVSGSGTNLQAIIDQCENNTINGKVVAVISNKDKVFALQRADKHGIPTCVISHKDYPDRLSFDNALADKISLNKPDLIVLAGFMRILSAQFVDRFTGKMLNIHPSLLPKYPGLHTHQKVLQNKDSKHGASIHFVTPELDGGPLVVQSEIDVASTDSLDSLIAKVAASEWVIYPLAIKWFCEDALRLVKEAVWFSKDIVKYAENIDNQVDALQIGKQIVNSVSDGEVDKKITARYKIIINTNQGTNNEEDINH